ncbi:MAG: hypothetical protein KY460_05155 [Actinobacteria bacterium]|nr:hypothetical protein [Actinomycetota bacterium]
MALTAETVSEQAGRPLEALTRRDVATALLTVPTADALQALPQLRRALLAAGNPLSRPFWDSTRTMLSSIEDGRVTIGAVNRWLQATGTEPIQLIGGGFVWPDEDERGPVAHEMHALLIAHLEELVTAGTIDPDRLAADDPEAWRDYEQAQLTWLTTPLPDGRTPMWAVDDEDTDAFLAAWDEAEADAANVLRKELSSLPNRPRPARDLRDECARLRTILPDAPWPYDLLRAAGGVDADALPDDDEALWLDLASGVVSCRDEPPGDDDESATLYSAWFALDHAAWIGAIATLARMGHGTHADADSLAHYAVTYNFAHEDDDAADEVWDDWDAADDDAWFTGLEDDDVEPYDDELPLQVGFHTVTLLWRALGAIDADERLTPLGWWGLPAATLRAWEPAP